MNRNAAAVWTVAWGATCIACSSASRPPGLDDQGSHDGAAADVVEADHASAPDGEVHDAGLEGGGDAATDAVSGDVTVAEGGDGASESGAGDAGPPPPPAAVCKANATWGAGQLLSISTTADDSLDAVSPDELSIAWTSGTGASAVVLYSDRTSTSDAFGTPQTLAAGAFATDRVAMSADGLRLVVVSSDGQGFMELTRASRAAPGNAFGAPSVGTYGNLDGALTAGELYGDPVLSSDDHAFYYSIYGSGLATTLYRTQRIFPGDSWPAGGAIGSSASLQAQGALRRQPTGVSSDEQTLFWDQALVTEREAYLDEVTGQFDSFVDLGARALAVPNTACSALYYSAQGASSKDLFMAGP